MWIWRGCSYIDDGVKGRGCVRVCGTSGSSDGVNSHNDGENWNSEIAMVYLLFISLKKKI